jgi:hypothetical protein
MSLPSSVRASNEHHAMKAYWEVGVWLHAFLTSALDWGGLYPSYPVRFTPGEDPLLPAWLEAGWWGEKFLAPAGTRTPDRPARGLAL